MITAVDTSVLIDVLGPDPRFGHQSARALSTSLRAGRIVASEVVWAEVAGQFASPGEAEESLSRAGIEFSAIELRAALAAGAAWHEYRGRGGKRLVPDFLIGAHAAVQADRLLTRDRGFYRSYFASLEVIDPAHT